MVDKRNMLGPATVSDGSSEVYFSNDADQEHYLTVMTNLERWRTPSPTPSPKTNSSFSSLNDSPTESSAGALHPTKRLRSNEDRTSDGKASPKVTRDNFLNINSPKLSEKFLSKPPPARQEGHPRPEIIVSNADTKSDGQLAASNKRVVVTFDTSKAASLRRMCRWGGCFRKIPDGGEVTVNELREMAMRQQQQIENQQQLLVAREQRLKYLKQQEGRAAQVTMEAERLRRLRERVEAQENKLRRLRALRGQVDSSCLNAASLSSDLEAMRHLFSEKEKELVVAASKVEELTRQLEDLRQGRNAPVVGGGLASSGTAIHQHHQELDKLRRELLYRNSVNREASARVVNQKEVLKSRKEEIARIDKRIAELQQRLHKKRVLNQQLASQISAATQAKQAQLKAVQKKALRDSQRETSADDITTDQRTTTEELFEFERGKHDPKYQTLPHNTKFGSGSKQTPRQQFIDGGSSDSTSCSDTPVHTADAASKSSSGGSCATSVASNTTSSSTTLVTRTVHSIPTHPPSKGHALAPSSSSNGTTSSQRSYSSSQIPASQYVQKDDTQKQLTALMSSSSIQESVKGQLPKTSLSLSFSQKLNMHTQPRALSASHITIPLNKDIENVRAMGHPPGTSIPIPSPSKSNSTGTNLSEEDLEVSKQKPILPPKPLVPTKPAPPPRQKGDLTGSSENLNLIGTPHQRPLVNRPQVFRYASQNVIMSTYTQLQQQQQQLSQQKDLKDELNIEILNKSNNAAKPEISDAHQDKVHVSINRRIEMPPDFMFPEDETPPSDLLGRLIDEQAESELKRNILESVRSATEECETNINGSHHPGSDMPDRILLKEDGEELDVHSKDILNGNVRMEEVGEPDGADTNIILEEKIHHGIDNEMTNLNDDPSNNNNNYKKDTSGTIMEGEIVRRIKKGNLKTNHSREPRRVSFDPLALLLDASLEGELELVKRTAMEVPNPSAANDEGITALHNAICAGHLDIVTFLVTFGYDVNAQDADGWTPLHCAASCNNLAMVRFLVEHGACVLATTLLDHETAAEKCEQDEEGYDGCSQYLYSIQEKLGIMNGGIVYGVYDYDRQNEDELSFRTGDAITIIRRGDEYEREWWWARLDQHMGYVPRNLLGLYPRVKNPMRTGLDS